MAPETSHPQPPKGSLRFLHWFCPDHLVEGIEGDLREQFEEEFKGLGPQRARLRFAFHVARFFRPSILLRNKFSSPFNQTLMISNYLKVASRNIRRQKLYSFINALGLSISIAFCLLIYLYIEDERSFDQFHLNKERIYRVQEKRFDTWWPKPPEHPYNESAWIQTGVGPALKADLAEVEYSCRYNPDAEGVVRYQDKAITEPVAYTDADFFKMFSFKLLKGNAEELFKKKSDLVITPEIAEKYFGSEDPMGKSITIDVEGVKPFIVAGVIEAPPANSSFDFKMLIPQENRPYYDRNLDNWDNFNTPTFVQLRTNADVETFKSNLSAFVKKHMGDRLVKWKERSTIPIPEDAVMFEYKIAGLPEIHLMKDIGWHKVSDPQYSMILGSIAMLILIIACINYISLALTTSAARRTEVGIRKVVGAQMGQLVNQFALESILLALISMVLGIGLVVLFLPNFNAFTGKGISLFHENWLMLLGFTSVLALLVGLLAGSYPALFLARFRPALVLKGSATRVGTGFAKPLVVLQFALSSFLIVSSVIMYRQMNFIATKDLGYNQHQVIVLPTQKGWSPESDQTVQQVRTRLSQEPSILSVSGTTSSFNRGWSRYGYKIDGEQKSAFVYGIDPYYLPTLDIKLSMGRNFDPAIFSDSTALIVNEALVKDMKWTDPLNAYLNWREDSVGKGSRIVGVVKDYHFRSLESGIEPMMLSMDKKNVGYLGSMLIKIAPENIPATMDRLRSIWREMYPDRPFDPAFLDEDVAKQYESYTRWMSIMGLSTGFAILISCLGLFGLSGINAVNRTKEIGIRKVMGAELSSIFILLNKPFVGLALIAFVIAAPASWYAITNLFLSGFKFKTTIGWELFAVSIVAGLGLALITVSYHAFKAALANPAETLKYE